MKEGYRPYLEPVEAVLAEAGTGEKGLSSAEAAALFSQIQLSRLSLLS